MSEHGRSFDAAQRRHDNMEHPDYFASESDCEECEDCVFNKYGNCVAMGDTDTTGDCPSFRD